MSSASKTFLMLGILIQTACTVHFHNTSQNSGQTLHEWHQCGLLRFDLSEPIDLSTRCVQGWNEVTTEKHLGQLLVTALSLTLYDPWSIQISCKKPK